MFGYTFIVWYHVVSLVSWPRARIDHRPSSFIQYLTKCGVSYHEMNYEGKMKCSGQLSEIYFFWLTKLNRYQYFIWFTIIHGVGVTPAPIKLDVICSPFSQCVCIQLFVSQNAWIASTSEIAIVFVYPVF